SSESVFVYVKLYGRQFTEFFCRDKLIHVGINLPNLMRALKSLDREDILVLFIDEEDDGFLGMQFIHEEKQRFIEIKLKLIDIDEQRLRIGVEYKKFFSMESTELSHIFRGMASMGGEIAEIKC